MNHFKQYVPPFVDCDKPDIIKFNTTRELLNLDIVKRYKKRPNSKFVMSGNELMVVSRDETDWWVVGYIAQPKKIKLPQWKGGE
jgi:hypothetical protein